MSNVLSLADVRADFKDYADLVTDHGSPYGCYRGGIKSRHDLYAACDMAISRHLMGENLQALDDDKRKQWIGHINSYTKRTFNEEPGGTYFDSLGHSAYHANGMVVGALGVLGGKQPYPCKLYDIFDTPDKAVQWLETAIDWSRQWSASHLFWGGMHCYSFSRHCNDAWRATVFQWLDDNLDPDTGWWRKGVPHATRNEPLGGSVHIVPIYQHHNRRFPHPEAVIDSVLALQLDNGRWLKNGRPDAISYLELDALYALDYMGTLAPTHRTDEIKTSLNRFANVMVDFYRQYRTKLYGLHPHHVLSAVGTLGLLNRLLPERFPDDRKWNDIFNDVRLYDTAAVEAD